LINFYGGDVDVYNGYYFPECESGVFSKFIDPLMEIKNEQDRLKESGSPDYNPSYRELVKLLVNSVSGKVGQQNYTSTALVSKGHLRQLIDVSRVVDPIIVPIGGDTVVIHGKKPESDIYNPKTAKPVILSVLIYSYSRALVYSTLFQYDVLYCDTDSGLFRAADAAAMLAAFPELDPAASKRPKELGDLEEELYHKKTATYKTYLIKPKEYAVIMRDENGELIKKMKREKPVNHSKIRAKGVGLSDSGKDRILVSGPDDTFNNMTFEQLEREYNAPGPTAISVRLSDNPEAYYEKRISGQSCVLLCSQLTRTWKAHGTGFQLKQRYLIKNIAPVDLNPSIYDDDPTIDMIEEEEFYD
jgi:hypothetical protein